MAVRNPGRAIPVLVLFLSLCAQAQEERSMMPPKGIQGSFVKQSMMIERQLVSLAEAIPQEKYSWRPGEGVRSIAESFLHCARGNYALMPFIGGKVPEGMDPVKLETSTTDTEAIIDAVKSSFKFINEYVARLPDNELEKPVKFFGMDMTVGDMIMLSANHQHEVLGQAVAYARVNGIVPPWTAERVNRSKKN